MLPSFKPAGVGEADEEASSNGAVTVSVPFSFVRFGAGKCSHLGKCDFALVEFQLKAKSREEATKKIAMVFQSTSSFRCMATGR